MRAKMIFESLTQIGSSSNRELFTARLMELQPMLRYCEYNLKRSEGKNADNLLSMIASSGFYASSHSP